eukprot:scaffold264_cov317-Pinguiococcus_pyrenoidosus.AAC.34
MRGRRRACDRQPLLLACAHLPLGRAQDNYLLPLGCEALLRASVVRLSAIALSSSAEQRLRESRARLTLQSRSTRSRSTAERNCKSSSSFALLGNF